MRILICEDSVLLREGIARLLEHGGHEVVAALPSTVGVIEAIQDHSPELCILDVRLPPTFSDEGVRLALELRHSHPELPLLVLSQYVEERYASDLIAEPGGGLGYLLKDRERTVLAAIAEGRSNQSISSLLHVSEASVEKSITAIFQKLGLVPDQLGNRRVLAAIAHIENTTEASSQQTTQPASNQTGTTQ